MPMTRRLLLQAPPAAVGVTLLGACTPGGVEALDVPALPGVYGTFGAMRGFRYADLKGSVTLLHALASWCPFCQQESAFLRTLAYDRRFQMFGLFVKDTELNAKTYISRHGNPYAAIGFDADKKAEQQVGVRGVPNSFIVDKQGRIVLTRRGMITDDYFRQKMLPLIETLDRSA